MTCGAYAQTNVRTSPPVVKFKTFKSEMAMRSGKFGKKAVVMQQEKDQKMAPMVKTDGDLLRKRVGNPVRVAAPKLVSTTPVASDKARITLVVESDWGDDSGYQVILDGDCGVYGETSVDDIFAAADYTIPENAEILKNFLQAGKTSSIDIPAGRYDFFVFNPMPSNETVYVAEGESEGGSYYFKGGYEYVFTVNVDTDKNRDNVELTCDSPVEIGVSEITAPVSGFGLTANENVTAKIYNSGSQDVTSFVAKFAVDGKDTVSETVNKPIAVGETIDYTFDAKADLSAPGIHNVTVSVENDLDGLDGNNSITERVHHLLAVNAPYICTFDSESSLDEWYIVDANNDGTTWNFSLENKDVEILYNSKHPTDDYLITMNPVTLPAGNNRVVVDYNAKGSSYLESFEVLYGKTSDVNEMTVLKSFDDFTKGDEPYQGIINFDTPENGDYYFAIHAKSKTNQFGMSIYRFEVSEGVYVGEPDLSLDKVILPVSSCSLGTSEKVSAVISNVGTGNSKDFTLEYSVNGTVQGTQKFDVAIPIEGSTEVTIDAPIDMSALGKFNVSVNIIDVTPADGQNPEVVTDNNSAESSTTHYTPTDVPFVVDFSDESQRENWASDDSWGYEGSYNYAMYCKGTTPLVSRGINMKAGTTYRLTYDYMAGMSYIFFSLTDDYDILIGKDGTPFSEWETLASYTDVYTNDVFVNDELSFTVPSDGIYSIAFKQDVPQSTFMLKTASITAIEPYDLAITGISSMPSKLPKSQAENFMVGVNVKNNGSESTLGTVAITVAGKEVGTTKFDIAVGETQVVEVPVTLTDVTVGMIDLDAEVTVDGSDDSNPADNTASASLELTDDVYAYDYVTDDMYTANYVIGVGDDTSCTAAVVFHINKTTDLKALSIGWGLASDSPVFLEGYKFDPNATPDPYGYMPLGEQVFTAIGDQGNTTGQVEYPLDEPTTLEPGDYIFAVTYTGFALVIDNVKPGQLYMLVDNGGETYAYDETSLGLGTPAIRAILGETTGINTTDAVTAKSSISYDAARKTIVATSPSSAIKSLDIYSASGTLVGSKAASTNVCSYDASSLVSGVYVVRMTTADGTVTSKVAVK